MNINFQQYKNEKEYVSPAEISDEAIRRIKERRIGITALELLKNKY